MKKILFVLFFCLLVLSLFCFVACNKTGGMLTSDSEGDGKAIESDDAILNITFLVDGAVYSNVSFSVDSLFPTDPIKEGYKFKGWYTDEGTWQDPFDENAAIKSIFEQSFDPIELAAYFVKEYRLVISYKTPFVSVSEMMMAIKESFPIFGVSINETDQTITLTSEEEIAYFDTFGRVRFERDKIPTSDCMDDEEMMLEESEKLELDTKALIKRVETKVVDEDEWCIWLHFTEKGKEAFFDITAKSIRHSLNIYFGEEWIMGPTVNEAVDFVMLRANRFNGKVTSSGYGLSLLLYSLAEEISLPMDYVAPPMDNVDPNRITEGVKQVRFWGFSPNNPIITNEIPIEMEGEFYRLISISLMRDYSEMPEDPVVEDYTFHGWYMDKGTWKKPFTEDVFNEQHSGTIDVYSYFTKD